MRFTSNYPETPIPEVSITDYILSGLPAMGDKPILVDGFSGQSLTAVQLYDQVEKCAAGLAARGFKKGDCWAIYSPNVIYYPVALFGSAKLGVISTLVNPLYNVDELTFQLKDASARWILTTPMFLPNAVAAAERLGQGVIKEIFVFGEAEGAVPFKELLQNDGKAPEVHIDPKKDLLCLPYSSGTSGAPKGVMLTHYNIVANVAQTGDVEYKNYDPEIDVFIGVLPWYHIYGLTVILNMAIRLGIKVVTMPRFDLEKFLGIIQDHKVTGLHIVPPIVLALAKHPLVDKFNLSSVKWILSGAAPLPPEVAIACGKRLNCIVKMGYGMTEMSPVSHVNPSEKIKNTSIGVLIPHCVAKIVDVNGNELDVDQEGELCVKGPNVMVGYLNNEQATKETIDEEGFLHTGDVGKVDSEGYYYVVDRVKELIKFRGHQVAPAELEALLLSHPAANDAAVIPVPDQEAGELPKAYVVVKPGQNVTPEEFIQFVDSKVSSHKKLRGGVEFIEAIPKSASGKILRRVLRDKAKAGTSK